MVETIALALHNHRPGCRIGNVYGKRLCVPRLTLLFRVPDGADFVSGEPAPSTAPEAILPERLAVALTTGDPTSSTAYNTLGPQDRVAGRRLYAAALRDLAALDDDATADCCGIDCEDAPRAARRDYEVGRELWHKLSCWPWVYFPHGKPPDEWRDQGADALVAKAFAVWQTGRL